MLKLLMVMSLFSTPAYAIQAGCTQTANLGQWECPANATDWFELITSSRGLTTNMDTMHVSTQSLRTDVDANAADGAVTTAKLGSGSVTTIKLGADAVLEIHILNGVITAVKLAVGAVTTTKLGADSVTTIKLINAAITAAKLAAASVTTSKVADGAGTTSKIGIDAIRAVNILTDQDILKRASGGVISSNGTALDIRSGGSIQWFGSRILTLSDEATDRVLFGDATTSNRAMVLQSGNLGIGTADNAIVGRLQLVGDHLRIGTGSTPDVTPGADDAFIEGTLEVDGASRFDAIMNLPSGAGLVLGDATGSTNSELTIQGTAAMISFSTGTTSAQQLGAITYTDQDLIFRSASNKRLTFGASGANNNLIIEVGGSVMTKSSFTVISNSGANLHSDGNADWVLTIDADNTATVNSGGIEGWHDAPGKTGTQIGSLDFNENGATCLGADNGKDLCINTGGGITVPISSTTFGGVINLISRTQSEFDSLTPTQTGELSLCSDCTVTFAVCVSTGTALADYRQTHSATLGCTTLE